VCLAGIDTLRVNVVGELHASRMELFDALQARAIVARNARTGRRDALTVVTPWRLAGEPLLMAPHGGGKGQWRWLLRCPSARFDVGVGHLNGIVCQVTLNAPFLWRVGARQAWAKVEHLLLRWCDQARTPARFQVSELHLCADVSGLAADALDPEQFVHRGRVARWVQEDADVLEVMAAAPPAHEATDRPQVEVVARYGERESLTFSRGAPHEAAIYNKPREIRYHSPDKLWFADLWRGNGWDGRAPMTRVEMRYGREVLRECGCDSVAETFEQEDALWAYSTREWLRHTTPNASERRRSLWPTSPWWQVVQTASFGKAEVAPAQRERVRTFQEDRILAALLGYVESWAAWRAGKQLPDDYSLYAAISDVLDRANGHYEHRGSDFLAQVRQKRHQLGFAK
jgi:hypothetical protein